MLCCNAVVSRTRDDEGLSKFTRMINSYIYMDVESKEFTVVFLWQIQASVSIKKNLLLYIFEGPYYILTLICTYLFKIKITF